MILFVYFILSVRCFDHFFSFSVGVLWFYHHVISVTLCVALYIFIHCQISPCLIGLEPNYNCIWCQQLQLPYTRITSSPHTSYNTSIKFFFFCRILDEYGVFCKTYWMGLVLKSPCFNQLDEF